MRYGFALIDRASGEVIATLGPDGGFHPHGSGTETGKDGKPALDRGGELARKAHKLESGDVSPEDFDGLSFGLVNDKGDLVWPQPPRPPRQNA